MGGADAGVKLGLRSDLRQRFRGQTQEGVLWTPLWHLASLQKFLAETHCATLDLGGCVSAFGKVASLTVKGIR